MSDSVDRVFVHLSKASRDNQTESPYTVKQGDGIDLAGKVVKLVGGEAKTFGVTQDEGAGQLQAEGAYIEATRVQLST